MKKGKLDNLRLEGQQLRNTLLVTLWGHRGEVICHHTIEKIVDAFLKKYSRKYSNFGERGSDA
jgi:hypothetical protein